jgi:LysR family transcriptional regulator, glycine cleavage system transcriptional activator
MRRLPPFLELVAFEAVARHMSFTRAAAELGLTQSAVSHRVRRLESHFGKRLIDRLNPGIALTDAGVALLPQLTETLEVLARLSGQRERRLRVAAASSLCTWWLAGRLGRFMTLRQGLSVELVPLEIDGAPVPEIDVRILWVNPGEAVRSATQAPLFNEQVFPVCSPMLLREGRPLRDPRALSAMTLLHKATQASGEWNWETWLDRLGLDRQASRGAELRCADVGVTLSAAVYGSGVALIRSLLAYDALQDGRLVIPVLGLNPMVSTKRHVARWRSAMAHDPDIKAFVSWLVSEAACTLASTDKLIRPTASELCGDSEAAASGAGYQGRL